MFILSQFLLNKSKLCKENNQATTYSIVLGLILYSSIYIYILFYNNHLLNLFNKFIIYIVILDLLLSAFYMYKLTHLKVNKSIKYNTYTVNTNDNESQNESSDKDSETEEDDSETENENDSGIDDENTIELSDDDAIEIYNQKHNLHNINHGDDDVDGDDIKKNISFDELDEDHAVNTLENFENKKEIEEIIKKDDKIQTPIIGIDIDDILPLNLSNPTPIDFKVKRKTQVKRKKAE